MANGDGFLVGAEDCLNVDADRCVVAHAPYDMLIPKLLNKHFASQ